MFLYLLQNTIPSKERLSSHDDNHSDMSEESTTSDSGRGGSEEDLHRGAAPQELGKDNL